MMRKLLKIKIEVFMLNIAIKILKDRNVVRSEVISRGDNNALWYMAEKIEFISERVNSKYE